MNSIDKITRTHLMKRTKKVNLRMIWRTMSIHCMMKMMICLRREDSEGHSIEEQDLEDEVQKKAKDDRGIEVDNRFIFR